MYVGRIVIVGRTLEGHNTAAYRVSSRSFPNREARQLPNSQTVSIMPKAGFESDLSKNPYIAYNCLRFENNWAIASNGSHTDPIAEKIAMGMPVRDAFTLGLLAMDYEKDHLNTPRIIAAVPLTGDVGFLGIVRHDAVLVRAFELKAGQAFYIATYEHNYPCIKYVDNAFTANTAQEICEHLFSGSIFANLENPVSSVAAVAHQTAFTQAIK